MRFARLATCLVVLTPLAACGDDGNDRTSGATSTTIEATASTDPTPQSTTTPSSDLDGRLLTVADLDQGWVAGEYDPTEVGSPCGTTNTDVIIVPVAKTGAVMSAGDGTGFLQEDLRRYADTAAAARAYQSLLTEVDCREGSIDDGSGGTIPVRIGPGEALDGVTASFDEALRKTVATPAFEGTSALIRIGDVIMSFRLVRPPTVPADALPDFAATVNVAIARLAAP